MKSILLKNRRIILHALLAAFIILVAFLYAKSQVGAHTAAPDPFQKTFFLISALMIIGLAVSFWLLLVKKVKLEYVFVLMMLLFGMIYSVLIPVRSAPDESIRIESALAAAGKMMGWKADDPGTLVERVIERDNGLSETGIVHDYYNSYFPRLHESESSSERVLAAYNVTSEVPKLCYYVPGFGIVIGRLLGLGAVPTLMLGRLMHLLVFILAGFYAIRRTPAGKELFFLIALFPMMQQCISTFSIDCIPLSCAFVLTAGVLYYVLEKKSLRTLLSERKKSTIAELILLGFCAVLLSACKYGGLLPVVLLLLLIVIEKRKKDRVLCFGSLGVLALGFFAGFLPQMISIFQSDILTGAGEPHYGVSDILLQPGHTFTVLGNTVNRYMDHYIYSTVGTSLGWFELNMPAVVGIAFLFILLLSVLMQDKAKVSLSRLSKALVILCACLGVAFAVVGMMLGNTPRSSEIVEGVQGRYFLPFLLPLLTFAGAGVLVPTDRDGMGRGLIFAASVVEFIAVMCLFIRAY